ncbi:hypothetical protein [Niallia sp. Krafla_26]|uniref:hypothetical protein n=1 Tax=Niallia sp. Krafla_26 TaxID=3064703 RepID=UPI003D16F892
MPSKQLVDLVNKLKSSGIQISFTKPRSKMVLHLYNDLGTSDEYKDYSCQNKNRDRSLFEYI